MVEVAASSIPGRELPFCFVFPSGNLLGFGDLALPGLFITYTRRYDLLSGIPFIGGYFLVSSLSYWIGMIATMLGLIIMDKAQPALLYLCPAILIGTALVAWKRGDWKAMMVQDHR